MSSGAPSETYDDAVARGPRQAAPLEPQLVVALECDRPMAGAARHSLAGVNEVLLGRGDVRAAQRETVHDYTTLRLRLPARAMSASHARLVRAHGQWFVEDAGSRNGTFVNGARVTRAVVGDRDVVEVGRTLLLLRLGASVKDAPADLDSASLAGQPPGFRTIEPSFAQELAALRRLAASDVPLLLRGETGTGKEVLARSLHALSSRKGPLVAVNCGALARSLVESQLFGHVKGAFSGATRDEPGFVRAADKGTLLLDEVGELPPESQATLLRVLQESEVVPVGSTRATKVDVRVVSATHRALAGDDAAGFRPDLYARLAGFSVRLPPLRERLCDLGILIADLLAGLPGGEKATLAPELGHALLRHTWPLNVRELHHGLRAALILAADGVLSLEHFPALRAPAVAAAVGAADEDDPLEDDEGARLRVALLARLEEHAGNVAAVARAMGKGPTQIHRWMKRFGIDPRGFRGSGR